MSVEHSDSDGFVDLGGYGFYITESEDMGGYSERKPLKAKKILLDRETGDWSVLEEDQCSPLEDPKSEEYVVLEQYVVGLRLYGVKLEFRSKPIPDKRHAADLVMQMGSNLGYNACLYEIKDGEERKLSGSELEEILK